MSYHLISRQASGKRALYPHDGVNTLKKPLMAYRFRVCLGLYFCLAILLSGCTATTPSSTPSSSGDKPSTLDSGSEKETPEAKAPSSSPTSPDSGVSGLDGEDTGGNATTPPSTPAPTFSGTGDTVGGSGGEALLSNLRNAGLSGEKLRLAWAVGMAESGGNPRAYNGNTRTGDQSYGLFQINMLGAMGPERRRQFGLSSNEELFDPAVNIRAMLRVSSNGNNWQPWSAYKNGSYRRYYDQFRDS